MRLREPPSSIAILATLLSVTELTSAFYIPGVAPTTYRSNDTVELNVNALTAAAQDGKLRAILPWDYYDKRFLFCRPEPEPEYVSESLGSIIFGDRIMTSPFQLNMLKNESCKALCADKKVDAASAMFINGKIMQGFNHNWLVDGLPAGQLLEDTLTKQRFYRQGFPMGDLEDKGYAYIYNHYDILIEYHEVGKDQYRVVGVIVQPGSRNTNAYNGGGRNVECGIQDGPPKILDPDNLGETITWTYGVYWTSSDTVWATRWDRYLDVFDPKIHWFSLVNSAIVVIFLSMTVVTTLFRALRKDIARYNRLESINLDDLSRSNNDPTGDDDGVQEDSGWKLVHGDVFRTPSNALLLSVFLGNGAQLFFMVSFTIIFALLGFLSPSNRGALGSFMILLYTAFGFAGGYLSSRVYKSFGGESWKLNIILTPILVPAIVFATFFTLDLFLWAKQSSGAVPFTTMLFLVLIWFVFSLPLSFAGSWVAFRQEPLKAPVRTNQIPRQIPPAPTYLRPIPSMLIVGILPFGAIFVELYFIISSIWSSKVYYMFGFLFLCYGLMIMTCAAVTVLLVYYLLCTENYHWQWRAFLAAGASAIYVFLNAMAYWFTKLELGGLVGGVLYLGYSALISFLFFILTGSTGFFASWWFVHKIYGSIKID